MTSPREAQPIRKGAQIAGAEGKVSDREGRLVAYDSKTCRVRAFAAPKS